MQTHLRRGVLLAALCAGLWVLGPSMARAAPEDHAAEAAPIAADLGRKYALPAVEAEALKGPVAVYLDQGGDARGVGDLAASAADLGCRAGCLGAALKAVNRAVWLGHPPDEAHKLVLRALKDAARAGGPGTLAERMQARMERLHRRSIGF